MVSAASLIGLLKGVIPLNCFIFFTHTEPTSHVPTEILNLLSGHLLEFLSFYFIMGILTESKMETITNFKCHCKFFVKYTLAPGGTLADDMMRTDVCVFAAQEDLETMQAFCSGK